MPRNVEIKARVSDMAHLLKTAKKLSNEDGECLRQRDIFYRCSNGRLKLRSIKTEKGSKSELIFYRRPDQDGPKVSDFIVTPVLNAEEMNQILSSSAGSEGVVAKERFLFMIGQTRVHVDKVEGLGNFMELEVQLRDDQELEEGSKIANDLMEKLGIHREDLVNGAYHDLLRSREKVSG